MAAVAVIWLVIIGTSIWVAIDASNIGARKGLLKGLANMGPAGWFFCCLILWIVGFPVYLAKRAEIRAAAVASNAALSPQGMAGPVAQNLVTPNPVPPPPGWYADAANQGQLHFGKVTGVGIISKADELMKLDALRQSGVLTQGEFDAEKAKLLGVPLSPPTLTV
jgi:hypothetical protein